MEKIIGNYKVIYRCAKYGDIGSNHNSQQSLDRGVGVESEFE